MTDNEPAEEPDETTDWGRYTPKYMPKDADIFLHLILRLVDQSCGQKHGEEFDSGRIGAYEVAIQLLHDHGFVAIDPGCGRICGQITPKGRKFRAWFDMHERSKRVSEALRHFAKTVPRPTLAMAAKRHNVSVDDILGYLGPSLASVLMDFDPGAAPATDRARL